VCRGSPPLLLQLTASSHRHAHDKGRGVLHYAAVYSQLLCKALPATQQAQRRPMVPLFRSYSVLTTGAAGVSECFKYSSNPRRLLCVAALAASVIKRSVLIPVMNICQPRWASPAFGNEPLPADDSAVGPWDGLHVSVVVALGARQAKARL
jgi:hypothetical protein